MSETSQAHVTCTILESRGRGTQIEGGMLRISVVLHKYKWRVSAEWFGGGEGENEKLAG